METTGAAEPESDRSDTWKNWDAFLESKTDAGFWQSSWYTGFRVKYYDVKNFGTVVNDGPSIVGGAILCGPLLLKNATTT